jgi:hypothetical protein
VAAAPPDWGLPEHSSDGTTGWLMARPGALIAPKISAEVNAVANTFLTLLNGTSFHGPAYTLPLRIIFHLLSLFSKTKPACLSIGGSRLRYWLCPS